METKKFSRRQALQATAILGTALLLPVQHSQAKILTLGNTPGLTPDEIAAIETAIGKKGSYKEAESLHTTALPRNDLKMTIKAHRSRYLLVLAVGYPSKNLLTEKQLW
jgi:hypothetical protein